MANSGCAWRSWLMSLTTLIRGACRDTVIEGASAREANETTSALKASVAQDRVSSSWSIGTGGIYK